VLPDISNPFFPALARGIDDAAVSRGYTLILCNTDGYAAQEEASVRALLEKQVDGIVFVTGVLGSSTGEKRPVGFAPWLLSTGKFRGCLVTWS